MQDFDVFLEVFNDVRFPFLAADLDKLRIAIGEVERFGVESNITIPIAVPPEKRAAFTSSVRGLLRNIFVPDHMIDLFSRSASIVRAGYSGQLIAAAAQTGDFWTAKNVRPKDHACCSWQFSAQE